MKQVEFYFSDANLPTDAFLFKKVKADAGRLMRPTSAHMRRTEEGRESRGLFDNGVTNVRYHSVKATPSWRQMR